MRIILPIFAILITVTLVNAQSFHALRRERSLILTVGSGTSTYFGELANPGNHIDQKLNFNAGLQHYVNRFLSVRGEVNWFQLSGDDAKADDESRRRRNLSFKSNNIEASLTGHINFFPQGRRFYQRPAFNVYGFGGVGVLYFNPKTELNGQTYALQPLKTEQVSYSRIGVVIPFGFGVKLKVGPFFNLSLEGGYRKTFTDYLDDVSKVHPGISAFSDPVAAALSDRRPELGYAAKPAGTQRGNADNLDGYFLLNAKIEYYLPNDFLFKNAGQRKMYNSKRRSVKTGGGAYKRRNNNSYYKKAIRKSKKGY